MNVIAIIGSIVGAVAGFWIGYASYKKRNKEGAIALGFLGAAIGAIAGVFLSFVVVFLVLLVFVILLLALFLYAIES